MYKSKLFEDKIGKLHHLGFKTHKMLNPFKDLKKTVATIMHETRLLKHKSKTLRGELCFIEGKHLLSCICWKKVYF